MKVSCNGADDGSFEIVVEWGGTAPYTVVDCDTAGYSVAGLTVEDLPPGTHTCEVNDVNGLRGFISVDTSEPAVLAHMSPSVTDATWYIFPATPTLRSDVASVIVFLLLRAFRSISHLSSFEAQKCPGSICAFISCQSVFASSQLRTAPRHWAARHTLAASRSTSSAAPHRIVSMRSHRATQCL